jgi:hypothetical protein
MFITFNGRKMSSAVVSDLGTKDSNVIQILVNGACRKKPF